jgi:hypothetical protein
MERGASRSWSNERRTLWQKAKVGIGLAMAGTVFNYTCVADSVVRSNYQAPWTKTVNQNGECPKDSKLAIINDSGLGNTLNGLYSAEQTKIILGDDNETCYIGFSYGTEYNAQKNAAVLADTIEKYNLKRVILFANSFGGIADVDMLNEYAKQHPDSTTDFSIVFISSPSSVDDLQPIQRTLTTSIQSVPMTDDFIQAYTFFTIIYKENKLDKQVLSDTNIASNDTPATLVNDQANRLVEGIGSLPPGMNVKLFYIGDKNDTVVNIIRAINTIKRATGQEIQVVYMVHSDHRQGNHSALWRPENNDDYRGPLEIVQKDSVAYFDKLEIARRMARSSIGGRMRILMR